MDSQRIKYLDIARGVAVLGIFTQHSMIVHELSGGNGKSLLSECFVLLGTAPSAPVFMVIMGLFFMRSKASCRQNFLRGLKVFALGYILNFLRLSLPLMIAGSMGYVHKEGELPMDLLFAVDIFQLAGLSLMLGSLIKKILLRDLFTPIILILVLMISPFLWGIGGDVPLLNLFWGIDLNCFFPFFPWMVYPFLGMFLSRFLLHKEKGELYLTHLSFHGLALGIIGFLSYDFFPEGDYHRSGAAIHLLIISFVFIWFKICAYLSQYLKESNIIYQCLHFWSRHLTAIYFIQWVLFGWSVLLFDSNKMSDVKAALVGFIILLMTHFMVKSKRVQNLFTWVIKA